MASSSTADANAAPSPPTNTTKPYLHGYHASVLRSHSSRTAQNSCPHLLPYLRPGMRVLDVGCGPGTITTDLAAIIASPSSPSPSSTSTTSTTGHITALDASPTVLATARAHAETTGTKNIDFRLGDACALPFADASFDAVHANQVVQHVADPVAAVREMRRVVRADGGVVALREGDGHVWFCPPTTTRRRGTQEEGGEEGGEEEENPGDVLAEWYELWLRMARDAGVEPMAGRRLLSYALRAGWAPDEVQAGVGSQCWAGREELREWCGMWADRVVLSEFADNAVGRGYATREGLERLAGAWRAFAEVEGAWYGMMQGEAILTRRG
ncbi:putative methyltransferase [Diplodia seriata]|uniref:Putative methyltransferase n=1 Tax=Diplodia seriata TaxID=420778 RepID=A0A1S8BPF6_9PEZI|nr:putative methyltransferase [Diplodia seriata]